MNDKNILNPMRKANEWIVSAPKVYEVIKYSLLTVISSARAALQRRSDGTCVWGCLAVQFVAIC